MTTDRSTVTTTVIYPAAPGQSTVTVTTVYGTPDDGDDA